MTLIKGVNSYLTVTDAENLLTLEKPDEVDYFKNLSPERKTYNLIRATAKIESLHINPYKHLGYLSFPLRHQIDVPFEVLLACAIEAFTVATKNIEGVQGGADTTAYKSGLLSESEKTASVSYSEKIVSKIADCPFDSLDAYNLLSDWIGNGERVYRLR